jgi:hypothetical protein
MDRRTALKKTAAWAGTAAIAPSLFSILRQQIPLKLKKA